MSFLRIAELEAQLSRRDARINALYDTSLALLAALQQATDAAQQDWDAGIEPPEWFEGARAAIAKAVP